MEMNEVDRLLPRNVANTAGQRFASGAINGVVEAAVGFVKDVIPDSLKA